MNLKNDILSLVFGLMPFFLLLVTLDFLYEALPFPLIFAVALILSVCIACSLLSIILDVGDMKGNTNEKEAHFN